MRLLALLLLASGEGAAQSVYDNAMAAIRSRDAPTALSLVEKGLAENPMDPRLYLAKGMALNLLRLQDAPQPLNLLEDIVANYSKAIELNPRYGAAYAYRGGTLLNLGRPDESLRDSELALKYATRPRDRATAYYNKGLISYGRNQVERALEEFGLSARTDPAYGRAYYGKGLILRYVKMWNEALSNFDKAISLSPHITGVWAFRADVLAKLHRKEEARVSVDRAILEHPGDARSYIIRGQLEYAEGNFEAALADSERANGRDPTNAWCSLLKGLALEKLGRIDEAIQTYTNSPSAQVKQEGLERIAALTAPKWGTGVLKCSDSSTSLPNLSGPSADTFTGTCGFQPMVVEASGATNSTKRDDEKRSLGPPSRRSSRTRLKQGQPARPVSKQLK